MKEKGRFDRAMLGTVFALAWPTMLEQLTQTAVQYIDTAMVGSLGTKATAAVGATGTVSWFIGSTVSAVGVGKLCNIKKVSAVGKTLNIRSNSNEILFIMDHGITEYWADDGLRYGAVEMDEKALSGQISLGTGICKAEVYRFHK